MNSIWFLIIMCLVIISWLLFIAFILLAISRGIQEIIERRKMRKLMYGRYKK